MSLAVMVVVLVLSACERKADHSVLQGDWTMVEVYGEQVEHLAAYISIDLETERIAGFLGCNDISGRIDKRDDANELDIEDLVMTQALCDNSPIELRMLSALDEAEYYEVAEAEGLLSLLDDDKKLVMVLRKRTADEMTAQPRATSEQGRLTKSVVSVDSLAGAWRIVKVQDLALEGLALSQAPTITFDVVAKQVSGNLSCNSFNARFELDDYDDDFDPSKIDFDAIVTTRMACEEMEVERRIAWALDELEHFYLLSDGRVALYEDDDDLLPLLILAR